jgi:hypothetical protein
MGYMGGFGGTDTLGAMSLDEGSMVANAGAGTITAYVRNIGKTTLSITTAYVDGEQINLATPVEIAEGLVVLVTIPEPATHATGFADWAAPNTYEIKLVGEDNTQLSFSLKCQ